MEKTKIVYLVFLRGECDEFYDVRSMTEDFSKSGDDFGKQYRDFVISGPDDTITLYLARVELTDEQCVRIQNYLAAPDTGYKHYNDSWCHWFKKNVYDNPTMVELAFYDSGNIGEGDED